MVADGDGSGWSGIGVMYQRHWAPIFFALGASAVQRTAPICSPAREGRAGTVYRTPIGPPGGRAFSWKTYFGCRARVAASCTRSL